jgi:phosphate/sulfate permease
VVEVTDAASGGDFRVGAVEKQAGARKGRVARRETCKIMEVRADGEWRWQTCRLLLCAVGGVALGCGAWLLWGRVVGAVSGIAGLVLTHLLVSAAESIERDD